MDERILNHEGEFAFKELTEVLGRDFQGQSFISEGFIFNLCTSGSMKIRLNYSEYEVSTKDLLVVTPKQIFSVLHYSPDFEAKVLFISLDFVRHIPVTPDFDWLKNINSWPYVSLSEEKVKDLVELYAMIERYNDGAGMSEKIRTSLVLSLLLIVASTFENSARVDNLSSSRAESITRRFFDLLLQHFERERTVAFYAGELCVTPKYLSGAVKSITHYSVQTWINEAVLFEAKRALRATDLTVQQISEKLHFPNASSFVRFFRTHIGVSPLRYRRMKEE